MNREGEPMARHDSGKKAGCPRKNAREAALHILQVIQKGTFGDVPLPALLAEAGCDGHEKAFLQDEVYGVLRLRSLLDGVLRQFLARPAALSALLRQILRMGAHELLFLGYVPAHATVDELASLARSRAGGRSAGLVNAVLRKVAASAEALRKGLEKRMGKVSSAADIAEIASVPEWLAQDWTGQYGIEAAAAMARSLTCAPQACWRVNMRRPGAGALLDAWQSRGTACAEHGFSLVQEGHGTSLWEELEAMERQGLVSRQGAASQLVAERVAQGLRDARLADAGLWDCCCGRGGKTAALLEQGVRVALASDASSFRMRDFKENMVRLGLDCPPCLCSRAQDVEGSFAAIFLDAPCSGTGTLARNPELRLRITSERLAQAAGLQAELLRSAWQKLLPNGLLFYATCALNRRENEDQALRFLKETPQAALQGMETLMPSSPGQDVLFLAAFQKKEG